MTLADITKLKEVLNYFCEDLNLTPVIGIECEFYIEGEDVELFLQLLKQEVAMAELDIADIIKEKGKNQYEAIFLPYRNIIKLIEDFTVFKSICSDLSDRFDRKIIFISKYYPDQPASALHVNINFFDKNKNNIYARLNDQESDYILYSIAALLGGIKKNIDIFAPGENCKLRYIYNKNNPDDFHSPKTVSWGGNNRSCALRIPTSTSDESTRRIEHRMPSSNADLSSVIIVILEDIKKGMLQKLKPGQAKCYGNAFDDSYGFEKLISNI